MKILVAGAGISGLTFAARLRRLAPEIEVALYEREAPTGRAGGYSLGLKGDAGLAVLKTLGLYAGLAEQAVTITNFVFCNQQGRPLLQLPNTGDEKRLTQRLKRQALQNALRTAVTDTPIHYAVACTGYQQTDSGVDVHFDGGQSVAANYLVAADGVASAVRQQMIGDAKHYLGLTAIVGDASIAIEHPLLAGGYFMTLGQDGSSVFCYRQTGGIHLSYTVQAKSGDEIKAQPPAALLERLQSATRHWHAPIPKIAAALTPADLIVRGYYDKEPLSRVRDGRVWLIGDAAHPMCPFQGQGANMAMLDGLKLAEFFATAASGAEALEADIVSRGRKAVLESRNAAKQFHTSSRFQQTMRDVGLQFGNFFIRLGTRKQS